MKGIQYGGVLTVVEVRREEVRVTTTVLLSRGEDVTSAATFSTAALPSDVLRACNAFRH